jgi:programmed cell death protein 4
MNSIGKGFERLLEQIDEVELDVPQAASFLASFIARAVVDEVLPPSFLTDSVICNLGGDVIEQAKILLSRDHGSAKLERIWGPGDGRPVEEMKVEVVQILQEYLLSNDLQEAERCLVELHAHYFFHEVVKRAVTIAMDKSESEQFAISNLLKHLSNTEVLSFSQAEQGFNRLYKSIDDILLDVPQGKNVLEKFTERAIEDGVLPKTYTPPTNDNGATNV